MSSYYNFKKIQVVPTSNDFLDIVLSKTQRKTPTVIHPGYKITRIRSFYMRKVKFAQDMFDEKLNHILTDFPKLDEIHPFYADLLNVLYDRDHYKLALGQINTAKTLIDNVAKDYARLLKFGDSLFRCKQLKRAALGRMATVMKRQKDALVYLEQVRQHMSRLPSIDPNTRTLLITGYPNVGKSSFMNKLTRAEVDVQPYAFTTKSLFVGHMDYKYLRWQVIDTPGILDHPLDERNTIEMQSITALAHLRACILFFIDLSEQCGYSIREQVNLYHSIKPLFAQKPMLLVVNKIDAKSPEQLDPEERAILEEITVTDKVQMVTSSCYTDIGVMDVRNTACDILLAQRVEVKLKTGRVNDVLNKLHVAEPVARDQVQRQPFVPSSRQKYDKNDPERRALERDIELEQGGAGVYNVNLKKLYVLENDEWKMDKIPEIMEGKNIADFIDPEIEQKLQQLEEEEEKLIQQGYYDEAPEEMLDSEQEEIKLAAQSIRETTKIQKMQRKIQQPTNHAQVPRRKLPKSIGDFNQHLEQVGNQGRVRDMSRIGRKRDRSVSQVSSRNRSSTRDRSQMGFKNEKQRKISEVLKKTAQRPLNQHAKAGEADRTILTKMPKHLFAGKRGMGKTERR